MELARRLNRFEESQTIGMAKLARELSAKGLDIINLSFGEPDFPTPKHICDAAKQAIDDGFTKYPPVAGYPELREAVSNKFKRENNLEYKAEQCVISVGAKHSVMNAVLSIVNSGDEVLIPIPYWVSYDAMVRLAEGVPVFINSSIENDYKITPQQLEKSITSKTKLFIFSSPCNPSGSVYSHSELAELVKVFERHENIFIISDEIYEHINFVSKHHSIAGFESIHNRVVTVNGVSKSFAMTGWRIGYIGAEISIAKAVEKIQSQFTSGACSIAQRAALAALNGDLTPTMEMKKAFMRRRDIMFKKISVIPGIRCNKPDGAFYLFPDVSDYFGKKFEKFNIKTSEDLCMYLLNHAHVSLVTGEAFGMSNCIRISYAAADEKLLQAMERIKIALEELK